MPGPLPSARTASNTSGRYSERGFSLGDQPHGHSAIDLTRQVTSPPSAPFLVLVDS